MEKMKVIARREEIERKLETLKGELKKIREDCKHEIIIMYKCSNYYWTDAKCLFCGEKIENGQVLKRKENSVINADIEFLLSDDNKYKVVKEKYENISRLHPTWTDKHIVAEVNKELREVQKELEETKN